jgi:hypothetical protein
MHLRLRSRRASYPGFLFSTSMRTLPGGTCYAYVARDKPKR